MNGPIAFTATLIQKDAQGHPKQLEPKKLSLWHRIYCSLIYSSGLFVGIESIQPLYDGRQLTSEVAVFLTPKQSAYFTLSEVEDLVPVLPPVLTPIYETLGILRYPTKSLRLASESFNASILTFSKKSQTTTSKH